MTSTRPRSGKGPSEWWRVDREKSADAKGSNPTHTDAKPEAEIDEKKTDNQLVDNDGKSHHDEGAANNNNLDTDKVAGGSSPDNAIKSNAEFVIPKRQRKPDPKAVVELPEKSVAAPLTAIKKDFKQADKKPKKRKNNKRDKDNDSIEEELVPSRKQPAKSSGQTSKSDTIDKSTIRGTLMAPLFAYNSIEMIEVPVHDTDAQQRLLKEWGDITFKTIPQVPESNPMGLKRQKHRWDSLRSQLKLF